MNILQTERLSLRELTEDDADFILCLLNEPSFLQNIGDRGVRTLAQSQQYLINGPIASYRRFGFGLYCVMLHEGGERIGICGLIKREMLEDVDIGFAFLPVYWSKGYAYESAAAVLAYGHETLGLDRIVAIVTPGNDRSVGLLEKLGLVYEKRIPWSDGSELALYAMNF